MPFLEQGLVQQYGWLDQRQFLVAVAIGMISPGPVVITATFVGYLVAGFWGSLVSTIGIFLPSFIFVLVAAPMLARNRDNPNVQGFVKGAYAAAIGTILGACILLGRIAIGDWLTALIGIVSLGILFRWKISNPAADRRNRGGRADRLSAAPAGLGDGALNAAGSVRQLQGFGDLQPPHQMDLHPSARHLVRGANLWMDLSFSCPRRLRRRLCKRLFRLRDGPRRVGRMAAHHHADANRRLNSGLWSARAGLRHLQAAPYYRLAEGLAARAWDHHRHTDRRRILAYLNPTYLRFGVGMLLVLYTVYGLTRPVFAPMKIGTGADIAIGVSNGLLGGLTGLGRGDLDDLVPMARLAKGRTARGVSAGAVCGVRGYLDISGRWRCSPGIRWRCTHWASHSSSPVFGPVSSFLEKSTMRHSGRLCWCFCCSLGCR